jgi:hypothetical protein
MSHRKLVALFAVSVLVALPVFASHGWSNYHWGRSSAEASIPIYRSLTVTTYSNWPDHLQKSIYGDPANPNSANRRGWNDSTVLALSIVSSATDSTTRYNCSPSTGTVRVCNYAYGSTGWAGLAQVWPDSAAHIQRANTKVNDTYMGSSANNPWRRHVMCQEVGHDFGLGHTSENGTSQNTCMDYYRNTSNSDWTSTGPNQHDFDQLRVQHHASTYQDPATQALVNSLRDVGPLEQIDMNEPWQWGTPFAWDHEGRAVAYLLDRSPEPGDEVVTRVVWANNAPDLNVIEREPVDRNQVK